MAMGATLRLLDRVVTSAALLREAWAVPRRPGAAAGRGRGREAGAVDQGRERETGTGTCEAGLAIATEGEGAGQGTATGAAGEAAAGVGETMVEVAVVEVAGGAPREAVMTKMTGAASGGDEGGWLARLQPIQWQHLPPQINGNTHPVLLAAFFMIRLTSCLPTPPTPELPRCSAPGSVRACAHASNYCEARCVLVRWSSKMSIQLNWGYARRQTHTRTQERTQART